MLFLDLSRICVINSFARRGRKYDSMILLLSEFCNFLIKKSFSSFICVVTSLISLQCDFIDVILDERSKRPGAVTVSEVLSRPVRNKSTKKIKKKTN